MKLGDVLTEDRCRERVAYWLSQLEAATAKPPRHGSEALREKVVATITDRLNEWTRRLQRFECMKPTAPRPPEAA